MVLTSGFDERRLFLTTLISSTGLYAAIYCIRPPISAVHLLPATYTVLFIGLISAFKSSYPEIAVLNVAYTLILLMAAGVLTLSTKKPQITALGDLITASVVILCFTIVIGLYFPIVSGQPFRASLVTANFGNIRFFNQYQTWALPFLAYALSEQRFTRIVRPHLQRTFILIIGALFWAMLWQSGGRGTEYATLIATLFVIIIFGRAGWTHALWMATCALAGLFVSLIMFGASGGANVHLASTSLNGRGYLWEIAWHHIQISPWLGIGPMQFATIDTGLAAHPHNAILQWAVEWGLPATVLIVTGLGWLFLKWLGVARRLARTEQSIAPPTLVIATTASLVAGSAHAMVSGIIDMPASQFMFVTVTGLAGGISLAASPKQHQPMAATPLAAKANLVIRGIVLTASLYVGLFTTYDYWYRLKAPKPTNSTYLRNTYEPRYWLDGTLTAMAPQPPLPATTSRASELSSSSRLDARAE